MSGSAVKIEVQDQFGNWKSYTSCSNNASSIKQNLQRALKTQLAKKSGKARAVDAKTGAMIDMAFA